MATQTIIEETIIEEQSLVPIPEYPVYKADALSFKERASAIEIKSAADYLIAGEMAKGCASLLERIDAGYDSLISMAHKLHKAILGKKAGYAEDAQFALGVLKSKMGSYNAEQERIRRAEEARLQEAARVHAEAEAKRLADEQAIHDAIELEAAGDTKSAEAVLNNPVPQPVYVPPVILAKSVPQAAGISSRKTWTFRITDINLVPREYLIVDEKAVGQVVRALKDKARIPGIETYPVDSVAIRK